MVLLDANLIREALEITPIDQADQFMSPPLGDAIMDFVNQLGYPGEIHFVSRMAVNNLYQPWRPILSMINQCPTSKTSGFDRPRYPTFLADKANLGIPTKKGKKTKPCVIPYFRFTKLIIYYLGRIHNIHQRSGSPLNLAEDDLSLGNLKFVPKGETDEVFRMQIPKELITDNIRNAPYYNAYLEIQPKPVPSKQSKPAPATKPKVTQEKSSEPSASKRGKVQKVRKGKSSMKMKRFTMNLNHKVKGKAIATDEQAVQSLLVLHTPKRKSTTDQFIFQSRTPTNKEASTRPSTQPQDDASANIVRDYSSPADAKTGADTDITTSTTNTEVLYVEDVQGKEISYIVVLEEKTVELDEGRAGPDPSKTPEARGKTTVETKAESIITVPIHQASTSVPPLSTPTIDLSPPKLVSSLLQEPVIAATTEATTTTLPLPPPPPLQQQSATNSLLASRVSTLEQRSPLRDRFRELPEADMKEILHQRMFESGSYKSLPEHVALYEALEASMERANRDEFLAEKDNLQLLSPQPGKLLTVEKLLPAPPSRSPPDWLKPVPEEDRPKTPEPDWINAPNDLPDVENNWADSLAKSYKDPVENKLLNKIGDMGSFIKWYCKQIGKKKLTKADLEGPTYMTIRPFHTNSISLQF
ncbi:hypothetical protein Tco_1408503 [Tanacetum coccineum]